MTQQQTDAHAHGSHGGRAPAPSGGALPGQGGTPPQAPSEYRDPGDPDTPAEEGPVAAPEREPVTGPRETAMDPVDELHRLERQQPLPECLPGAQSGSMDAPREERVIEEQERVIEEQDGVAGVAMGPNPPATGHDAGIDR